MEKTVIASSPAAACGGRRAKQSRVAKKLNSFLFDSGLLRCARNDEKNRPTTPHQEKPSGYARLRQGFGGQVVTAGFSILSRKGRGSDEQANLMRRCLVPLKAYLFLMASCGAGRSAGKGSFAVKVGDAVLSFSFVLEPLAFAPHEKPFALGRGRGSLSRKAKKEDRRQGR